MMHDTSNKLDQAEMGLGSNNHNHNRNNSHTNILPIESDHVATSLPSAEELKTTTTTTTTATTASWMVGVSIIVLVLIVIVTALAVANRGDNGASNAPNDMSGPVASFSEIQSYLIRNSISSASDLNRAQSPQALAARWLAEQDPARFHIPSSSSSNPNSTNSITSSSSITLDGDVMSATTVDEYKFVTRYVMAVLYFALQGPTLWYETYHFVTGAPTCAWNRYGASDSAILLSSSTVPNAGLICNTETDFPERLILSDNGLEGELPTELGFLSTLRFINLKINGITGSLPEQLCQLSGLESVYIDSNDLVGSLPTCLGASWTRIQNLMISNNHLTGRIVAGTSIFTSMSNLELLAIDDNQFSGDIHFLNDLLQLELVYADNNLLTGSLTDAFVQGLNRLRVLDLSNNQITSNNSSSSSDGQSSTRQEAFPSHLLKMPRLEILDLSYNRLKGTIPDMINDVEYRQSLNEALRFLSLHNNPTMTGSIPDATMAPLAALEHVDVSACGLVGPMPEIFGTLNELRYLFMGENDFDHGPIPEQYANLANLEEVSAKSTHRHGPLPDWIGSSTNLILLDLDNNEFNGTIPDSYGKLTALRYLLLNRNPDLFGNVPASFANLTSLETAFVDGTALRGSFTPLCGLSQFGSTTPSTATTVKATIYADCGSNTEATISCTCCTCCQSINVTCTDPAIAHLESNWESRYGRQSYDFSGRSLP